jgi:hypothetical protein
MKKHPIFRRTARIRFEELRVSAFGISAGVNVADIFRPILLEP